MDLSKNGLKKLTLTIIRVTLGWHFLYEGISKLFIENWSSQSYLANTSGFLSGFYQWLAGAESLVKVVDVINIYGLILIGLALFVGIFIRIASAGGILLLVLYYFAYPPFGSSLFGGTEGHFYVVDRNFIETGLRLEPHEKVAGFIHIGTETSAPPERPRPDLDAITTWIAD